ncbi:hypothetical protein GCM10029992_03430 [Glycomyces albus]
MTQSVPVLLSTTSVYPEPTAVGFELAAELGYDGVELMVFTDRISQDPHAVAGLSRHYGVKVGAVHAPCLLVTQRVWSADPWTRLRRSVQAADYLGAPVVVIHPPFSWQRDYASKFSEVLASLAARYPHITIAVENMFPLKLGRRRMVPYRPHWDPTRHGYNAYTLDLSHCAASGPTRWPWPLGWARPCATSTCATAPPQDRTSTWFPGAGRSRARSCCRAWARPAGTGRSPWRSRPASPGTGLAARPTWPSPSNSLATRSAFET